jgi:hypothetical protein
MSHCTTLRFKALALGFVLTAICPDLFAQPKTIRVPQDHATIQAAIDAAANGDTVLVAEGSYSVNLLLAKKIVLGSLFITDRDTSHISKTILDGASPRHSDSASVILIGEPTDTTTKVIGFTIRNGGGTKGVWAGVPYVLGGGIAVIGGGASILHNRIIDNHCTSALMWSGAAGIDIEFDQAMTVPPKAWIIADNLIANNVSTTTLSTGGCDGGGIAATGQGWISDNTIIGNAAIGASYGAGGGLVIYGSPTTQDIDVSGNLFRSNSARNVSNPAAPTTSVFGGAIAAWPITISGINYLPVAKISNNLIVDNLHASAVYVRSGSFTLINNTITGNRGGSGIRLFNTQGPLIFRMLNNIVWNPLVTTDEIYNSGLATGSNNLVRGGFAGMGNIDVDPAFVVGDTLYSLQVNSPCINAGARSAFVGGAILTAPSNDFAGLSRPRPAHTNPDIGAMENNAGRGTIRVPQDHATIQGAIDAAVNGDTVLVANGTYSVNLRIFKKIVLASHYLINGDESHIAGTILDGGSPAVADSASVILIGAGTDSSTQVTGFTIRNGRGTRYQYSGIYWRAGFGINITAGGARITRNIIMENSINSGDALAGGGISVYGPALDYWIIEHNRIVRNHLTTSISNVFAGAEGGGAWLTGIGRFRSNVVYDNAAIHTGAGSQVYGAGGGVHVFAESLPTTILFERNHFRSNRASRWSAAIYLGQYLGVPLNATFVNNIISANEALGSSLILSSGTYTFVNNTFVSNQYTRTIWVETLTGRGEATLRLLNNIFWDPNSSVEVQHVSGTYAYNLYASHNLVRGGLTGTNTLTEDPWFVLGDTLYRPSESMGHVSPVFGKGALSAVLGGVTVMAPSDDYFGTARPRTAGSNPDLGAVESDRTTLVGDMAELIPSDFGLDQNYPNPFNPETRIGYRMKEKGWVRLSVANVLGEEVAVLVDGEKEAGYHEAVFSSQYSVARLPSGVYFYRISVSSGNGLPAEANAKAGQRYEATRKMVMIK